MVDGIDASKLVVEFVNSNLDRILPKSLYNEIYDGSLPPDGGFHRRRGMLRCAERSRVYVCTGRPSARQARPS